MSWHYDAMEPLIPKDVVLNQFAVHITTAMVLVPAIAFTYLMGVLWYRQIITFFTDKTTTERFGRRRRLRTESITDNESTTTSMLAE